MIEKGMVVRSKAGHDGNRFFVVVDLQDSFAYIADGKTRRLASPKKKSLKHLQKTNTRVDLESIQTDNQLKRLLHPFNYGAAGQSEEGI